jgi:hypothetical protein
MSFNARIKNTQQALGVTGFTGAAPQTASGNTVLMVPIQPGTLSANVYAKATTNTLTITGKWQVSDDGTTFRDAYIANRPANVTIVAGTGAAVSDNICVAAPDCVYSKRYARFVLTTGVGVGGGAGTDEGNISYNWMAAPLV